MHSLSVHFETINSHLTSNFRVSFNSY